MSLITLMLVETPGAFAQSVPPGWSVARPAPGMAVYTPADLKPGEIYNVTLFPRETLGGKSLEEYLRAAAGSDPRRPGPASGPLQVRPGSDTVTAGTQIFKTSDGRTLGGVYTAASPDGENVRLARVVFTSGLFARYKAATLQITGTLLASLKTAPGKQNAVGAGRNPTWGGRIREGVYAGTQYNGSEGVRRRLRVYLYADGEYRICDAEDKDFRFNTGHYKYNPQTGRLTIDSQFDLESSTVSPEDFCRYGHDASDRPLIYAENDHGVYTVRAALTYAGPAGRPSPETEARTKAAAAAEAARYKWVTPPGRGVKPAQIAGVWHFYDVKLFSGGVGGLNTNITDQAYLLLTDGTVHKGLPVPPDQLDVARSRRQEPSAWGRWHRAGSAVAVAWAGGAFRTLRGKMTLAAAPGQRLAGRWGTGSSSASMAGGSYRLWGVTFTQDGRFVKDGSGGSGNSLFMQTGGQPAINSTYDDNGSYTSVQGGDFTVGTGKRRKPGSDRSGAYSLSGYVLTLHYDSGAVARLPFFFGDSAHNTLWFEGAQLARDKDKN